MDSVQTKKVLAYVDDDKLEEIRSECAKFGQMELFSRICMVLGREDDDDYEFPETESDESTTDDDGVTMGVTVEERIQVTERDGFHSIV
jgi:hypothetical protein